MKAALAILVLICCSARSQSWHAVEVYGFPVPVTNINRHVALPLPSSHSNISLVSIFTTTNTPELLGDLTGGSISATVQLATTGDPMIWFGNDTGGLQEATIRLYFTTTTEPYNIYHVNANETQYWWADYAMTNLSNGNNAPALAGTYTLTAALDPSLWSDSLGHSGDDPTYTADFYQAVSQVAQIGFSFGGGNFFDTGIGILNANDPWPYPSALLYICDYQVSRNQAIHAPAPAY